MQTAKENPALEKLVTKKKPGTARKYLGGLRTYWVDVLSKKFGSFTAWVESVKKDQSEVFLRRIFPYFQYFEFTTERSGI